MNRIKYIVVILNVIFLTSISAMAATFTVNTISDTADASPGDGSALDSFGETSLRAAIEEAEVLAGPDTIIFDSALVASSAQKIQLSIFDTGEDSGEYGPTAFIITTDITITGPSGDNGITIERTGSSDFRFAQIMSGGSLTIENLYLTNFTHQGGHGGRGSGGGGGAAGMGGCFFNEGTLLIENSTLADNSATGGRGYLASGYEGGGGGGGPATNGSNNSGTAGGVGGVYGGGKGGNGGWGAGPGTSGSGVAGLFGAGGGGGAGRLSTGGSPPDPYAVAGNGGDGGFGAGAGGGGSAWSYNGARTPGSGGTGGFGGGDGENGYVGDNVPGGDGGGGAGLGGAIFNNGGSLTINNSTIANNTATAGSSSDGSTAGNGGGGSAYGGGIFNYNGTLAVTNGTIAGNTVIYGTGGGGDGSAAGGGVYNLGDAGTAICTLNNDIIADSTGGDDFTGTTINGGSNATSGIGNLIENQSGFSGTIVSSSDPGLASLAKNRGPTPTMAIGTGSPALDAGDDGSIVGSVDQRGGIFARLVDGDLNGSAQVDIGAFELIQIDYGDAPDYITGTGPTSILLPSGTSGFRISVMGNDSEADSTIRDNFSTSDAAAAYNSIDNEILVVWRGEDDTPPLVDGEYEIHGQRINAETGAKVGSQLRISVMGSDSETDSTIRDNYFASEPSVAWNSVDNQYLVVWQADDDTAPVVDNEFEIFGQRLSNVGAKVGSQFRISVMGDDSETDALVRDDFRANSPEVAHNPTDNEYLVVWHGDDDTAPLVDNENEIYGQRISNVGAKVGSQFRISVMGDDSETDSALRDNFYPYGPSLSWNATTNQYLVVWQSDDDTGSLVDNEFEIYGQLITAAGTKTGSQLRISTMGTDGDTNSRASDPWVAYNTADNEFFVVWYGDQAVPPLLDNENEVYGVRLKGATGVLVGSQFRISEQNGTGNSSFGTYKPKVAYNSATNSYFTVWYGDGNDLDNKFEIWGRRISSTGSLLDAEDVKISTSGPETDVNYDASTPFVVYNSQNERYLTIWQGDDDTAPLVDNENEIFGQLLDDVSLVDYRTTGGDNGASHQLRNGLQIGAVGGDSESDAQVSLTADGDDTSGSDDEDGASNPVEITSSVTVAVTNTTGENATLYGWIDFDGDGEFENATERSSVSVPNGTDGNVILNFTVPGDAVNETFARFRLSTQSGAADPTGHVTDGEVEDYPAEIPPSEPNVDIQGNSISIIDGDITPSTADHTDFGAVTVASGSVVRTFTIQNVGTENLTLTGSPAVLLSSNHFSVTSQPSSTTLVPSASTTFEVTFDPSGWGTNTAIVSVANNDPDENPYTFTVGGTGSNQAPVAHASADDTTVPLDVQVTLTGAGSSDPDGGPTSLSYEWTQDPGNPASVVLSNTTAMEPTFTPTVTGSYTFELIVYDGLDTDTDTVTVTVIEPVPVTASFTVNTSYLSAVFTDSSSGDPLPTTWFWDFGDGNTSIEQDPTHVYAAAGTYTVCLTASRAGSTDQACDLVPVVEQPEWTLTIQMVNSGSGSGTVTSTDGYINCGTNCSSNYLEGTVVTLTAAPDSGSRFIGWSGHSDCLDGQVTMNFDIQCTANFDGFSWEMFLPAIVNKAVQQ